MTRTHGSWTKSSAAGYNLDSHSLPQIMMNRNKVLQQEFAQQPWEQSTPAASNPCPPVTDANIGLSTWVCNFCHHGHTNHQGHSISQLTHHSPYNPKDSSTADSYKWAPNCLNAAPIFHLLEWKTNQLPHISCLVPPYLPMANRKKQKTQKNTNQPGKHHH